MTWVIICRGVAGVLLNGTKPPPDGAFLSGFDPEYASGAGRADWTTEIKLAMLFDSFKDAVTTYKMVPFSRPLREDGMPNRPMTTYTVEIAEVKPR